MNGEKEKDSFYFFLSHVHIMFFQAYFRCCTKRYCPLCFNSTDKKQTGSNNGAISLYREREIHVHLVLVKIYVTGHMTKCRNLT